MDISDYVLLAVRTSDLGKKQLGISTFMVDTRLPGIEVRKIPTLSQHAIGTTEVTYTDVRVPHTALHTPKCAPNLASPSAAMATAWSTRCGVSTATPGSRPLVAAPRKYRKISLPHCWGFDRRPRRYWHASLNF